MLFLTFEIKLVLNINIPLLFLQPDLVMLLQCSEVLGKKKKKSF